MGHFPHGGRTMEVDKQERTFFFTRRFYSWGMIVDAKYGRGVFLSITVIYL